MVLFLLVVFNLADHLGVGDLFVVVGWDDFILDDNEGIGAFDLLQGAIGSLVDALAGTTEFIGEGRVPDVFVLWMMTESTIFESFSQFGIEDTKGPCVDEQAWVPVDSGGLWGELGKGDVG